MKQEMMEWQRHQLDHMRIICTLLQTDNHASTSSFIFYTPDALPDAQPIVSKHRRQLNNSVTKFNETLGDTAETYRVKMNDGIPQGIPSERRFPACTVADGGM